MKLVKKTLVFILAFILFLGTMTEITSALAAEITAPKTTVLQNNFVKITVDNSTGRFGIRTVEGQPIRKNDQNVNMLFRGEDPETSFTTFRIDGTDYIFGNPYKFAANFFSETTPPRIVQNSNGTKQIETIWKIKGVEIKQILLLYTDASDKKNAGNVNIRYEVVNRSNVKVEFGTRVLLDTMVAGNDGPEFQIGTAYKAPLMVERKLVHNPEDNPDISVEDRALHKLPPYWVMRDKLDLTNPLATNVIAYGFNNFAENNINIVDEMIVGHWNGLANTKWDYTPNGNLDFTRDTNDYGTADSAVAFYWQPKPLAAGAVQSYETVYGLGEIIEPDKVFSIRFMDTPQQLATLEDESAYANEGIFDITAEIENLAMFNMEHQSISVEMNLDSGLSFVKLDKQGNIVRDNNGKAVTEAFRSFAPEPFFKGATPEEAAQGIKPTYKPGDAITVSFKVQAKGKPWPTNQQYMLTVRSPQTEEKIAGVEDEGIKAQYESSQANFILLPAVGQATATYAYGLSPKELYSSDVKYITVNMTNIDAYNTGNETTAPNFDLYLKEKITGKRYKLPVKDSVILQPTDDGFSGDMRITYRGGDLVDQGGNIIEAGLGPELPLGEYQVQIDYKSDTGGNDEIAALYDITTSQTFFVTDNQQSRVREAGILAVYKQNVDLSHVTMNTNGKLLDTINEAFPGKPFATGTDLYSAVTIYKAAKMFVGAASNTLDPKFKLDKFLANEALEKVPAYQYKLFASEKEMEQFFKEEDANKKAIRESLVVVRGMIKQVGTGSEQQVIVDTKTEPAIINGAVAYKGKDMVFVRGKLDIFGTNKKVNGYESMPFFDTLFVKGDGRLSVASSGFVFHQGEWTLDFFNGFDKSLGKGYVIENEVFPDNGDNEEDKSLNGSLSWAVGALGDRLNPLRQLMIGHVYFNKHSLFAPPSFSIAGFGFTFNDFILRHGGISFGGKLSMKIVDAEVRNVIFNDKGFVGVDAGLKFDLNKELGLFGPKKSGDKKDAKNDPKQPSGEINIVHYVQKVPGVSNRYGVKFEAQLKNMLEVQAELSLKQVEDGRILPDVIAFGTSLGKPGVLITGATYLTKVRGAVRELADTIAGGTKKDPFPLVIQAGVSMRFGIAPAYLFGDIDLTVKRTGLALQGKLDFSVKADPGKSDLVPMLSKALLEAQWVTPWFVRLEAEVDIGGWDIIMGKAGIFVGENLEKKRTDFEGYIGARVQIPSNVPVVGGMPLSSVFFGVNNDKIWGSVGILFISLGVTYYWGGGLEFGTSGEGLPDGLIRMIIEDPERGPQLLVIGQGMETLATSWLDAEKENHEIIYRNVAEGVSVLDDGSLNVGIGGITVKNSGRVHEIPMNAVSGNAIIEMEYTDKDMPSFTLKDAAGKPYPIVFDNNNTNPLANAYTQYVPAAKSVDGVDVRKAYIIIPQNQLQSGGTWTLTSVKAVETKLMNVPTNPQLKQVSLSKNNADSNKFTASWAVENAKQGDTMNLYLAQDAVSTAKTKLASGEEVLEPGDPGLLIAKDVPVAANGGVAGALTTGSTVIDVTRVSLLGDVEDIRGLLQQGNYYLRAELKSNSTFGTKTSAEKFEIIDPLAPKNVSDVKIEPAGNGLFALSFKPAQKKSDQTNFEHSYVIQAFQEQNGKLNNYPNFGELLFTEEELAAHWNPANGKYEGILLGGWTEVSSSDEINLDSLEGSVIDLKEAEHTGLEVGQEYTIGVSAVTKPSKEADKNENYHYAGRTDSVKKLLPVPVKPKLTGAGTLGMKSGASEHYMELLTNKSEQSIELVSDQKDIEVEAFYAEQSLGKVAFVNKGSGSSGTLHLDSFQSDGPYAIELVATNTKTKDVSVTMLYLTVDKIPPVLYIDEPLTGARTHNGQIQVSGTTSNDAVLTVNGTTLSITDNGSFNQSISVTSGDPSIELKFTAHDGAGNENTAVVAITNDQFDAPVALVLKKMAMKPGDSKKVEAFLRMPDGKNDGGKPKFKEVPVSPEDQKRLSYSVEMGEAVMLSEDGKVSALAVGASLIQAEYQVSEGVALQAMMVASVDVPAPERMGSISASTTMINNDSTRTKVVVSSAGDLTGQQLVYKVYAKPADVVLPQFRQNIDEWSILPQNGVVAAKSGEYIVIAKRTSGGRQAVAVSEKLAANVWYPSGGGGGGGGGFFPGVSGKETVTVNEKPVNVDIQEGVLSAHITLKDIESTGSKDIVIASQDTTVKGYSFRIDKAVGQLAVSQQRKLIIDVPAARLVLTPDMLTGMEQDLEIKISPNSDKAISALTEIAASVDATLLASGEGAAIETNLPANNWKSYMDVRLAIPDTIQAEDITAVVLMGPDGNWTQVPWKLAPAAPANPGNKTAYANIQLTGEGNLVFIRNTKAFKDVAPSFWGKASISEAAAKLFVVGKAVDSFEPESKITRAEYPTILLRVAGLMNKTAKASFTDVKEGDWFNRSVSIAAQLGIVNGLAEGLYAPQAPVSRIEAMTMAGRLLNVLGISSDIGEEEVQQILSAFKDRDLIPDWGRASAALSIKYGIIEGENNNVNPRDVLTRAQAAAIAVRLNRLVTEN
ncbi:S-layer homology domain-containing protein [Paenibacillus eucommiae]|uniref:SLH domain-containing protein n=1 Tax=Paenibacillus eucommiae TaxID=1355755 RepID=A0ABS4IWG3_9BACL|nr:S-layer homology domain-containing protein [Paenibacillus eucommiae]MBP1991929.1 hypothetical protein [Paenibacillus eucommiae]